MVETSRAVNIVLEFAEGGELFNQVEEDFDSGKLNENVAKFQFYQICATIQYLHRYFTVINYNEIQMCCWFMFF